MIASITRVQEKILRCIVGDVSVHIGLEDVVAEIILGVRFIPIAYADLVIFVNMASNRQINVVSSYHGIGIGKRSRVKERVGANCKRI